MSNVMSRISADLPERRASGERFRASSSLLKRLRALESVSELVVAVAGAVAVVVAVLVAVIRPLVVAGCRVIRK